MIKPIGPITYLPADTLGKGSAAGWYLAAVLFAVSSTPAFSQQQQQQQQQKPPEFQAMVNKLMEEINSNVQCTAALISDRREIAKLKDELETLKNKKEIK